MRYTNETRDTVINEGIPFRSSTDTIIKAEEQKEDYVSDGEEVCKNIGIHLL